MTGVAGGCCGWWLGGGVGVLGGHAAWWLHPVCRHPSHLGRSQNAPVGTQGAYARSGGDGLACAALVAVGGCFVGAEPDDLAGVEVLLELVTFGAALFGDYARRAEFAGFEVCAGTAGFWREHDVGFAGACCSGVECGSVGVEDQHGPRV